MILQMAVNFCGLFSFSVLSYWPFQSRVRMKIPFPSSHPFLIGIMSGITGIVLMGAAVHFNNEVIVDARIVVIVFSGLFGGPVAPLISGLIISITRILIEGITMTSVLAGLNTFIIGTVITSMTIRKPMTFKNAGAYFIYATIQTSILLAALTWFSSATILLITAFLLFSFLSFYTILLIFQELELHFKKLEAAENLAETDFLTGLYNNRRFQDVTKDITRYKKNPFSVLLLDIDHFKHVNDTYGHAIGDEVLRELASRIRKAILPYNGISFRNGGEEFTVILPGIAKESALQAGEDLRMSIARHPFELPEKQSLIITVSVGISSFPANGSTIKDLTNQADVAMYHAKHTGRNQVHHIEDIKTQRGYPESS